MPPGFEPMRWNSVKKTAQWAVFRNSPEGFSLRGRGARSAARNPGGPAIVLNAVLRTAFFIAAAKPSCTPYCLSAFGLRTEVRGASASRQYGVPGGFSLSGVRKRHLDNSPAQPFQKNSPKVGKCSGRRAGVPVIYSLALHAPCAVVAQLVEQLTRNEQVTGSSPVNGSMNSQRSAFQRAFCFLSLYAARTRLASIADTAPLCFKPVKNLASRCVFGAFAVPFAMLVRPYLVERSKIVHLTTCAGASEASAARPRYRGYCD